MSARYDELRFARDILLHAVMIAVLLLAAYTTPDTAVGTAVGMLSLPLIVWWLSDTVDCIQKHLAYREYHTELRFRITGKRLKIENHYNP